MTEEQKRAIIEKPIAVVKLTMDDVISTYKRINGHIPTDNQIVQWSKMEWKHIEEACKNTAFEIICDAINNK